MRNVTTVISGTSGRAQDSHSTQDNQSAQYKQNAEYRKSTEELPAGNISFIRQIRKAAICVGGVLLIFALSIVIFKYREHKLQQTLADNVLRFHVLANSDTKEDQSLKLKVRDAVGAQLSDAFSQTGSLDGAISLAETREQEIRECAEQTIAENGYDYPVQVQVSEVRFPVKTYGAFTFPAGEYQALEVIIGEGEGHNWWCVMYPNLCFAESTYEAEDEENAAKLMELLSEDTYEELIAQGKLQVKFKGVELVEELVKRD